MSIVALGLQLLDHTFSILWWPHPLVPLQFHCLLCQCLRQKGISPGCSASLGCMEVFGGHMRCHLSRYCLYPSRFWSLATYVPGIAPGDRAQFPLRTVVPTVLRACPGEWGLLQRSVDTGPHVPSLLHPGERRLPLPPWGGGRVASLALSHPAGFLSTLFKPKAFLLP